MISTPLRYCSIRAATFQFLRLACLFGGCLLYSSVLSETLSAEKLPLQIKGEWLPGSMLIGKTKPQATVTVMGKQLIADDNGTFVFGLGRDVTGNVDITVAAGEIQNTAAYPVKKREYDIQRIDGVEQKYVTPPDSVRERIRKDITQVKAARKRSSAETYFMDAFIWPANGRISGVYGSQRVFNGVPKRPHFGLDIAGPTGTPVVAPVGGVVTLAVDDMYYSGGTLILDHGYGISSTFIHLSKILVIPGQRVKQGDVIARIGATGRVTGPHLDWRVNWFDVRLDPQLLLPEQPATTEKVRQ